MGSSQKPDVTAEEVQKAQDLWIGFTGLMKWGVIVTIVCLALMAIFLI